MLKFYDKNMQELKPIPFIELQWIRKTDSPGNFVLYTAAKYFNENIKFIENVGRPELGIVQKVDYEEKPEGNYLTLSGYFFEFVLSFGATYETFSLNNASDLIRYTRKALADSYSNIDISVPFGSINQTVETGKNAGEIIYGIAFDNKHNTRVEPSGSSIKVRFSRCRDLRNEVYFGAAWNDVKKISYTVDDSNVKTKYYCTMTVPDEEAFSGKKLIKTNDGVQQIIVETYEDKNNVPLDLGTAKPVKVYPTNVSGVEIKAVNESEIRSKMREEAKLDMLNNYKLETVTCDVLQNRFYYLKDYDLGDTCSVMIDDLKMLYSARIIEIHEVHSKNKVDIQVTLGTSQKQIYRKVLI